MPTTPVVFMVDDEPYLLKAFSRILAGAGIRVLTHDSPAMLLTRLDVGETPALIITDYRMPEMTGDAVAIAARERGYKGPILLFTGTPPDETPPGVDRMISKPIDSAEFRAVVTEMLVY